MLASGRLNFVGVKVKLVDCYESPASDGERQGIACFATICDIKPMNYESPSEFESNESMNPTNSDSNSSNQRKETGSPGAASNSETTSDDRSKCQCSYCGSKFYREDSKFMPFCSNRCKQIDLGMWLNESYRLPHEGESSLTQYEMSEEDE